MTDIKIEYIVMQNYTKEVFRAYTWEECIDYLNLVIEEYKDSPDYILRYNERDGSLVFQDIHSGKFVTKLSIRIYDPRGGSIFNGFNLEQTKVFY